MRIPQVRERLVTLSEEYDIPELAELAGQLVRRFNGRVAAPVSASMTPELAAAVEAYAAAFPAKSMHEVGQVFSLNQGRVSEILHGKRQ